MGKRCVLLNNKTTCGGEVISALSTTALAGKRVADRGDKISCLISVMVLTDGINGWY